MKIIGMNYSVNANGEKITTLHVADEFNAYYADAEAGRGCMGMKADSIYAGSYDCSAMKIGMEIDVLYDKAITTSKGTFQTIKRIDFLNK